MDSNNWRSGQNEAPPPMDGVDWRSQLLPESRQRIANKIVETLKRHLPFSGQEGLQELKQIAIRFEEKIYSAATSQHDYLRKLSIKMLTMESKYQNSLPNALPSNSSGMSRNPQDSGSMDSTAQTSGTNAADWKEEVYQKLKNMDMYFADLNEIMYQKISRKLQQYESLPEQPNMDQLEQLRMFKSMLEVNATFTNNKE